MNSLDQHAMLTELELSMRACLPRSASEGFTLSADYGKLWSDQELSEWIEFGDPNHKFRRRAIPCNLSLILPCDPELHQWPDNFLQWVLVWEYINQHPEMRYLLPLIRRELELIIMEYQDGLCDPEMRESYLRDLAFEVYMFTLLVLKHFASVACIKPCIEAARWWRDYMADTMPCIDEDGVLDSEQAASNALQRWAGKP